jgi:hypothetical protein
LDLERSPGQQGRVSAEAARLCRVAGLNQNYTSRSGMAYHIQIEDRGPVKDRLTGHHVRRLNVVVYANYGDLNARIIHGCDHDYPDIRTQDHDAFIAHEVQEQAASARTLIEERERRKIERIKRQIRQYYVTKSEAIKKDFEETNAVYPFLFSRAWRELREERAAGAVAAPAAEPEAPFADVLYPLDTELREHVLEIERVIIGIGQDVARLRAERRADEKLAEACGKVVGQARAVLSGRDKAEFNPRRLRMLRSSLLTAWRRVHAQLDE